MNSINLVGRLVADPELRVTPTNVSVASFRLAVNRPFTNQQGEREADFFMCLVFRKKAESISQYLKKGHQAGVSGRAQTRTYNDKDGKRVFVTEIICENVDFLEPKEKSESAGSYQNAYSNQPQGNQGSYQTSNSNPPPVVQDDDLPF